VIPGPGKYIGVSDVNDLLKKTSDSKNGFGNFASKTKRNNLSYVANTGTPGAGAYNVQDMPFQKHHDFFSGNSRLFKKPICEKEYKKSTQIDNPAPNQYDISLSDKLQFRVNNTCAIAAFKSRSKRAISENIDSNNPAPCAYNINEKFMHNSVKVPFSSFKSKTKRTDGSQSSIEITPGPADYKPNEFDSRFEPRQLLP
jgi:hypothetical protein